MKQISHHIPDELLAAYVAGSLPYAYEMLIATHVSMCDSCRAAVAAHEAVGGALIEEGACATVSTDLKADVLALLDAPFEAPQPCQRNGIYPGPLAQVLRNGKPRWRPLGGGVRQDILQEDEGGSVRLLYIPPGQGVPDHGHNGLELTLVLQGSFHDETGHFGVGDIEVADSDLEHTPIAGNEAPCICLAATDAPLRFQSWVPRLLQPVFRI